MSKVYSDSISEKYKKYIIKVKTTTKKSYFLLWGTHLENDEEDYLVLDSSDNILAFTKIKDLIAYMKKAKWLSGFVGLEKWAYDYKRNRAYSSYNLLLVYKFLNDTKNIEDYDENNAMEVIGFLNLFSDYAYQINNSSFFKLYREANVDLFKDFLNFHFFWNNSDECYLEEMKIKLDDFDFSKAKEKINEMIYIFEERLVLQ